MTPNSFSPLVLHRVSTSDPEPRNDQQWWSYGKAFPLIYTGIPPFQAPVSLSSVRAIPVLPNRGTQYSIYVNTKTINGVTYSYYSGDPLWIDTRNVGRYYLTASGGGNTYMSDIFTVVKAATVSELVEVDWWDDQDFIMDDGAIVYNTSDTNVYKNRVLLKSDIAEPDYVFEEEGETRDGYFFPIKQISEKRYRFQFLATEPMLDAMRLVRMSDNIVISYKGQTFYPDNFLMTPTWEGNGNVASVICEFDTDTVAKKIGRLITT